MRKESSPDQTAPVRPLARQSRLLSSAALVCMGSYIKNKIDPDQSAPLGTVWLEFLLFVSMINVV